jgi:hypothetical protein
LPKATWIPALANPTIPDALPIEDKAPLAPAFNPEPIAAVVTDFPAAYAAPLIAPLAIPFKVALAAPPTILVATPLELISPLVKPLIALFKPTESPNLLIA